jgi:putative transposase
MNEWNSSKSKTIQTFLPAMTKKRFAESQIYHILRENEAGVPIQNLIKKYGVSQATIYNWRIKYGDMNISEIRRLNELEEENDRLKRMFADLSLENLTLRAKIDKEK